MQIDPTVSIGDLITGGAGAAVLAFAWKASFWASRMQTKVDGHDEELLRVRRRLHDVEPIVRGLQMRDHDRG